MYKADDLIVQKVLEMCKYIEWTNVEDLEEYRLRGENDEKVSRNTSRSCAKV